MYPSLPGQQHGSYIVEEHLQTPLRPISTTARPGLIPAKRSLLVPSLDLLLLSRGLSLSPLRIAFLGAGGSKAFEKFKATSLSSVF